MDGILSSRSFDLSQENLSASTPSTRVDALCSFIFASEHQHVWGLLRASRDVWSAWLGTENMSDPVSDQSRHHSCSVSEDKMQSVTSGLLAGAAAASAKAQNPLQHLCYLCHHIISCMCFSATFLSPLCFFLSFTAGCSSNLESEIRQHYCL